MELIKELQAYDENLTVKEVILQINEREVQDDIISKKYKNSYLKMVDECPYFGSTIQVFKIESLEIVKGKYILDGEAISLREESMYKTNASSHEFSAEELEQMEVITKEEYRRYVGYHKTIKEQLKIPMSW